MEYTLNVVAERSVVRESLKGILWLIFFHRLFGPITPSMNLFFEVPYPVASNMAELDTLIDTKIDQLIRNEFDVSRAETKVGQAIVQFLDRKKKSKKTGWFGQKTEDGNLKLWESWIVNVKCVPVANDTSDSGTVGNNSNIKMSVDSFESNLNTIVDIVDTHKDHIPPITSLESSPFPYTIDVDRRVAMGDETWGKYIKRMLD